MNLTKKEVDAIYYQKNKERLKRESKLRYRSKVLDDARKKNDKTSVINRALLSFRDK